MARYTVLLSPAEAGGYVAMVPMFNLVSEGDTVEHALDMTLEAIELRVEAMIRDGDIVLEEEMAPIVAAVDAAIPVPA